MAKVGDKDIENRVFEATKELLLNNGVKGWNMDDLSEECGMSKRTLYKIIATKEELLLKTSLNSINHNISRIVEFFNSGKSYEYLLDNFSDVIIKMFDEFIIKNADALRKEYPRIGDMINKRRKSFNELYIEFFRKGKELGYYVESFDPELMYSFLNDIIEYNLLKCKTKKEFEEKMYFAINVFIRGVRKIEN